MKVLILAAALALSACATTGAVATGLAAAGLTADAYCQLTPEGRAAIRERLGIDAQLIGCANDAP